MRVLVCGGRTYADDVKLRGTLDALDRLNGIEVLIEGCATGADQLAETWAREAHVQLWHFPADWYPQGKDGPRDRGAGFARNSRMLTMGRPDLVVAFPGGPGTADTVTKARRAGIPVTEIA